MKLSEKACSSLAEGVGSLESSAVSEFLSQLTKDWSIVTLSDPDGSRISHEFSFSNFVGAMEFVNQVAKISEAEQHHPDIHIYYNRVVIELWTHTVKGLSENDFIIAAKIEALIT